MKRSPLLATIAAVLIATSVAPASAAPPLPLAGVFYATETFTGTFVEAEGSGIASLLGRFTIEYQAAFDPATGHGTTSARLTAANGDQLFADSEGQATPTSTPGVLMIVENYTVTGGSGRLSHASGEFRVQRLLDVSTGATCAVIRGRIALH